jgi:hypothetical protein
MFKLLRYSIIVVSVLLIRFDGFAGGMVSSADGGKGCNNFIAIDGSSNINQFRLVNYEPKIPPKIHQNNHVQIPVYSFQTSNKRMLSDFYDMVNASTYPYINIVIEPKNRADFDEGSGKTRFRTEITIAGKTNQYIVPSEIIACEHAGYVVRGDLKINLTDFEIDPPRKVFGAVKVNNEVFINFAFKFQADQPVAEDVDF